MEKVQTSLQNWAAEGSIPERVHRTWVVLKEHPFQFIGKVLAAIIIIAAVVAVLILG